MRLENKTALITGGTSGIGRRVIERFTEEGAKVAFTGRRADLGAEVASVTGASFIQGDAGNADDAANAVATAIEQLGGLDILMNNAGAPAKPAPFEDLSLENFDATMAVHVRGALAHSQHAARHMRAQKSGSIINVGSIAGHRAGYTASMLYAVAKAAVIHMTKCAAMELGEDGVRVNCISPGVIATGIFAKAMGMDTDTAETTVEKVKPMIAGMQAVPRAGETDDIANAAVYLGSAEAGFVNGVDIVIDGGLIWGRRYSETSKGGGTWSTLFD